MQVSLLSSALYASEYYAGMGRDGSGPLFSKEENARCFVCSRPGAHNVMSPNWTRGKSNPTYPCERLAVKQAMHASAVHLDPGAGSTVQAPMRDRWAWPWGGCHSKNRTKLKSGILPFSVLRFWGETTAGSKACYCQFHVGPPSEDQPEHTAVM